jgi:RNA polymerase sigma-70 factor (ECF subfamily)
MSTNEAVTAAFDYESTLEACARGDRHALRALYDNEAHRLLGVALRIVRDHHVAQDVLQDAFVQIWRSAGTFQRALGSGRGWLHTVVRRRALDAVRRGPRELMAGDDLEAMADAAALLVNDGESDAAEALSHCLKALDERKRVCIVAAYVNGYTHQEIAQQLQAPLGSVKAWIRRGLLSLRQCMS